MPPSFPSGTDRSGANGKVLRYPPMQPRSCPRPPAYRRATHPSGFALPLRPTTTLNTPKMLRSSKRPHIDLPPAYELRLMHRPVDRSRRRSSPAHASLRYLSLRDTSRITVHVDDPISIQALTLLSSQRSASAARCPRYLKWHFIHIASAACGC